MLTRGKKFANKTFFSKISAGLNFEDFR